MQPKTKNMSPNTHIYLGSRTVRLDHGAHLHILWSALRAAVQLSSFTMGDIPAVNRGEKYMRDMMKLVTTLTEDLAEVKADYEAAKLDVEQHLRQNS